MNVYEFAGKHLGQYKKKGNEIVPTHCPFCNGGDNHDKETFALNVQTKTYNCKRGSCNKQGNFFQLCKEFGEKAESDSFEIYTPKRDYKKPKTKPLPLTTEAEKYLALRKISKETMDLLKVSSDDKGNIVFPYYQNGELVFVKFRPARKIQKGERKAWRESETMPILWNMDSCTPDKPLIITEGEFDTLSLYEAGVDNVVSVPSGTEDFSWVENCWDWLKQFEKFVLFGDSDGAGREMVKKTVQKLGHYKCSVVEIDRKDANEVLFYDGKEAIKKAVANAKEVPIYGIVELADIEPLNPNDVGVIRSGMKALDEALGGFRLGELSVWTGKRGEGKSTIMNQLMIEAIYENEKVCMYSGEMNARDIQYWINLQLAGRNYVKKYFCEKKRKEVFYVPDDVRKKIINWYRGKFFLYDNNISASKSEEASILKVFEYCVKKYDTRVFVVDNLMTARYETTKESDYYLRQINFVNDLLQFAANYNVHIHLVAHPKKTKGKLDNDDISGRSEITNLAHNVFAFERTNGQGDADLSVDIMKNRWEGVKESIGLYYCPVSRRIYSKEDGPLKRYGWESDNAVEVNINLSEDCPF